MASATPPILPDDLKDLIPKASDSRCRKIGKSLIGFPVAVWRLIAWGINPDGTPTDALKEWIGSTSATSIQPPATVTASSDRTADVTVQWASVAEARSYQVWRGTTSDTEDMTLIETVTGTAHADTTAVAGTVYYYAIKAAGYSVISGFSTVAEGLRKTGSGSGSNSDDWDRGNAGVFTVTVPAGMTKMDVTLWGAGGKGGNYEPAAWVPIGGTPTVPFAGAGGASGNYVKVVGMPVVAGEQYTVTIASSGASFSSVVKVGDAAVFIKCFSGGNGQVAEYVMNTPLPGTPGPDASISAGIQNNATSISETQGNPGVDSTGGAAIEVDDLSAGAGGDGTTSITSMNPGGAGRAIIHFSA